MMFTGDLVAKIIIAIIAGGLSFGAAWILRGVDRSRAFKDKRIEHAESTITNFSQYIESWKRLITIATLQIERELSDEEKERMERYIKARDDSKHFLIAQISTLPLFFDFRVVSEFDKFKKWDNDQSVKRLNELPDIEEWEKWLRTLSVLLQKYIN